MTAKKQPAKKPPAKKKPTAKQVEPHEAERDKLYAQLHPRGSG